MFKLLTNGVDVQGFILFYIAILNKKKLILENWDRKVRRVNTILFRIPD